MRTERGGRGGACGAAAAGASGAPLSRSPQAEHEGRGQRRGGVEEREACRARAQHQPVHAGPGRDVALCFWGGRAVVGVGW